MRLTHFIAGADKHDYMSADELVIFFYKYDTDDAILSMRNNKTFTYVVSNRI